VQREQRHVHRHARLILAIRQRRINRPARARALAAIDLIGLDGYESAYPRELSGGSDEASALFRSSITLSRDIVRTEGDVARLAQIDAPTVIEQEQIAALRAKLAQLGRDQTAVLARLAEFPRYRSISNSTVTLASLQQALKGDEAYYKLILLGDEAYGITIAKGGAAVVKIGATAAELGQMVKAIRDSVVLFENDRPTTYPFDVPAARRLYGLLTGPGDGAAARLVLASRHLVVEPDGALLQLPFNLLVTNDDKLAEYKARQDDPNADPFDARGIAWLGRDRMISTATSARSFMDVRNIAGSRAANAYLGLGENAVPAGALPPSLPPAPPLVPPTQRGKGSKLAQTSNVRGAGADSGSGFGLAAPATPIPANSLPIRGDCDWPLVEWSRPISSAEIKLAADLLKAGGSKVTTGAEFTDTALMERRDLKDYRVIHFATHGLVTAPRPECPARPALLTSFGGPLTDGLLSFRDIFDLSLDADTIILSACDTAGAATASATREAGITTGGNFALDGLVRAFVGAGARAVIASHWPVPDSFDATKTLITGLFADAGEVSVGEALRRSQLKMMDVAETSHPYYWSGFAIIGDAAKPLISSRPGARPGP
jgi:CHAT domain-containing protein